MKKIIALFLFYCLFICLAKAQDSLKYSKKQVANDINYLLNNAADIHPNLYHSVTRQQLTVKVDSLTKTLSDSLSLIQAYRAFAQVTAFINEGHTGVNTPKKLRQAAQAGIFKMIPLRIINYNDNHQFEGQLILPAGNIKQVSISSINGIPSVSIFEQLLALKGGLTSSRKAVLLGNFRLFLAVLGISQPYRIDYTEGKVKKTVSVNGISESEYNTHLSKPVGNAPYIFTIEGGGYGYLNFKSMNNYDKFVRFCDSTFEVLDHQQIKKLVIDLRENSGGNSALGRYLLYYLTDKPFRMSGESERKVSQQFRTYISANRDIYGSDYDGFLKLPNGSFYKMNNSALDKPEDKKYKYNGKVCFLIGPYTFSSANMLAATVKDYKLSTLIGEPTGEPANDYGELMSIDLPNTGLTAFTSTTFWVRPNNDKADHNPIWPDYLVKSVSGGNDNVLKYAIEWLNN